MARRLWTGLMSQHPVDNYQCHGLQPDDTEKFNVNDTLITTHVIQKHCMYWHQMIQPLILKRFKNLCWRIARYKTLYYSVQTLLLFLWYLNCLLGSGVFLRRFVERSLIRMGFVFSSSRHLFHQNLLIALAQKPKVILNIVSLELIFTKNMLIRWNIFIILEIS